MTINNKNQKKKNDYEQCNNLGNEIEKQNCKGLCHNQNCPKKHKNDSFITI
ncbi:hypothetical protein MUO14_09515 [Halobacillus shinanisalinarum]|uniref:Uncharacterized protein n=1 Tax=Halobacillus shinanisalinarum TaxID=2932258 RepID=A0ABY4H5D9_9BACI|nr:hypothetical protein [Halobacillus shinanisalinarum]UOQ95135.1 hypothetical protein MUO14_09515 [Halobacillus shinanisalinarum]